MITRAAFHAQIRDEGHGQKLDKLLALLEIHKADLNEVIRLATTPADVISVGQLQVYARKAAGILARIENTLDRPIVSKSAYGSLGVWQQHEPAITDLLRSARWWAAEGAKTLAAEQRFDGLAAAALADSKAFRRRIAA